MITEQFEKSLVRNGYDADVPTDNVLETLTLIISLTSVCLRNGDGLFPIIISNLFGNLDDSINRLEKPIFQLMQLRTETFQLLAKVLTRIFEV